MLTLSILKYDLKTILKILGTIFGAIVIIFIMIKVGLFIKEIISPTPPPPPEAGFGKLPSVNFPKSVAQENLKYRVDTLSGALPSFYHLADVYRMKVPTPDLLAVDRANKYVRNVGFGGPGVKISENVYQWQNQSEPQKTLTLNLLTSDFFLKSSYLSTESAYFSDASSKANAINIAANFLTNMNSFFPDINPDLTTAYLYSIKQDGSLTDATSLSTTQAIGVYFFQKDVGGLPIYYPLGKSTMSFLLTKARRGLNVVEGSFFYQAPDENIKSNYSIKTNLEAFEDLKKGNAYIASFTPSSEDILIKKVYLGYFLGEEKQEYLMPIFIFEGNNNFLAYVSAVRDEWIDK